MVGRGGWARTSSALLTMAVVLGLTGCGGSDGPTGAAGPTAARAGTLQATIGVPSTGQGTSGQNGTSQGAAGRDGTGGSTTGQAGEESAGPVEGTPPETEQLGTAVDVPVRPVPMNGYKYTVEQPLDHAGLVFDFADGLLRISHSCVSILGAARLDDVSGSSGTMTVQPAQESVAMCDMEAWLPDDIFDRPVDFRTDGDRLTISYADQTFELAQWRPVRSDQPLENVNWQPTPALEDGLVYGTGTVMQLGDEGLVLQETYCRQVRAAAQVDPTGPADGTITLSDLTTSKNDCPRNRFAPVLDAIFQEQQPIRFRIELDRLTLTVHDTELVLHTDGSTFVPSTTILDGRQFRPSSGPLVDLRFLRGGDTTYLAMTQGCGLWVGAVEQAGDKFSVPELAAQSLDCPDQVSWKGKPAADFLSGGFGFDIDSGQLVLDHDGATVELQATYRVAAEPDTVPGVWRLALMADDDGVRAPPALVEVRTDWQMFDPDDHCRSLGGDDGGPVLARVPVLVTACPGDRATDVETAGLLQALVAGIDGASEVLVSDDQLLVRGPRTSLVLTKQAG